MLPWIFRSTRYRVDFRYMALAEYAVGVYSACLVRVPLHSCFGLLRHSVDLQITWSKLPALRQAVDNKASASACDRHMQLL